MDSKINSSYQNIKNFLSIPSDNRELEGIIERLNFSDEFLLRILEKMYEFINYFAMFNDIEPFMKSLFITIKRSFEFKIESIEDFQQILIKNTLTRLIQEYLTYSKTHNEQKVLGYLTDSLQKLQIRPLLMNLGLIVKPMYEDEEYVEKVQDYEEVEVTYVLNDDEEIGIKKQIDNWLETRDIRLNKQDQLEQELDDKFTTLINQCDIEQGTEKCDKLWTEVLEMLRMKLTVASLMDGLGESGPEPISIK
jgi:hypothetical protein